MKFSRLYRESRLFWPPEIDISDGRLIGEEGGYFPTLSEVWRTVELKQDAINEWHQLMSWAMFCAFHKKACEKLVSQDLSPVRLAELDRVYAEAKLKESLFSVDGTWPRQMRRQYRNDVCS